MAHITTAGGPVYIWSGTGGWTYPGNTTGVTMTLDLNTWQGWNAQYTTAATGVAAGSTIPEVSWGWWNTAYEETAEQKAAREEQQRAYEEQWRRQQEENARLAREEAARLAAAKARSEELLLSLLTEEQARSYTEDGWFEVTGSRGGRWRIRNRGQAGNVDLMPEIGDVRQASYCCHPPGGLPAADAHLAQMLHIVTDEDGFRRVANPCFAA